MIHSPTDRVLEVATELASRLNGGQAKPRFAVGGSMALRFHGVPVSRPAGDIDIVAVELVKSAAGLRRVLVNAGCENLPSPRSFPKALRNGCVPFVFDGLQFDLLHQHAFTARAIPLQAAAAARVTSFTRQNISLINGTAVLDIDAVVLWQALFNREKDRASIAELIKQRTPDGQPAIRNRQTLLDLVVEARSEYGDEAKFLKDALWKPWYHSYH